MAVSLDGVKFIRKPRKGLIILMLLALIEAVFTVFLFISLSAHILFPQRAEAAGVAKILSYQGRLTNAAGEALGNSGTTYYFCFSIYDNSNVGSGTKLWPSGTPTQMSATVTNGIFNADIGSGADDLSTFNFYSNDAVYLQVEVSATSGTCGSSPFETLDPRQRISAVGYARATRDIYGDLLRTYNETSPQRVQVGTGGGASTPIYLSLDVKNNESETIGSSGCSSIMGAGRIWYNSQNGRALICENNVYRAVGNLSEIAGIQEQGASSAITSGTIYFSGQNNLTISQDGQTLKFSAGAGGGSGVGGVGAGTQTATGGTVVFSNSNNISFGLDGQIITASVAGIGGGGVGGIGVSNTTYTSGTVILSGGNNITVGTNGQTITIAAPGQSQQTQNIIQGAVISGNTSGATASITSGTLQLAGGNNITLSQNANSITILAGAAGGGGIASVVASDATYTSGSVQFTGSNMVTVRSSANQRIVIDASQSVQTQNLHNVTLAGNSTSAGAGYIQISSGVMTLAGGNNITLSQNGNAVTISGPSVAGGLGALAAGTQTATSGTMVFSNSNNVSFGMSNSSIITASMSYSQSTGPAGIAGSAASTVTAGTVVFSNLNNVSFGLNGSTMTASIPTIPSAYVVSLNGSTGQLSISGGNNITVGNNASTITISGHAQQTGISGLAASGSTYTSGTVALYGSNITLSTNGQSITISAISQSVQTQNLHNVTLAGNSTSAGAGYIQISSGVMTLAGGNNITLSQNGNAVTISGGAGGGAAIQGSGTYSQSTGTVQFANSNNLTFGLSNNGVMTASASFPAQTAFVLSNSNGLGWGTNGSTITGSYSVPTQTAFVFSNSNGMGWGTNGSTVTASYSQSTAPAAIVLSSNTAGAMATISSGTMTLAGGPNITLSQAGNAVTISGAAGGGGLGGISAEGSSVGAGTVVFSNSNNVSFGMNGSTVTASAAAGGGGIAGISASNSLYTSGTVAFYGGNNITLSTDGQSITISAFNQSVQTGSIINAMVLSSNTAGAMATISSGTMTLAGGPNITLSQAGNAVTISGANAAAGSNYFAITGATNTLSGSAVQLLFAGGNNITLSQSIGNGANSTNATITISAFNQSTQPAVGSLNASSGTMSISAGNLVSISNNASTVNVINLLSSATTVSGVGTTNVIGAMASRFALEGHQHAGVPVAGISGGNTSNTSGTYYGSLMFAGGNNITLSAATGAGGQTVTISALGPQHITLAGNTAGVMADISSGTMTLAGGNNITLSQAGNAVTISALGIGGIAANAATTYTSGTVVFSAGNNITLNNAGQTINIVGAGTAITGGATVKIFEPYAGVGLAVQALAQGTLMLQPIYIPFYMTATKANILMLISNSASAAGTATINLGIYTYTQSTANSLSTTNRQFSYNSTMAASSYTLISGTRYRSISLNNWAFTPGDYLLGVEASIVTGLTSGSYSWFGRSTLSLNAVEYGAGNLSTEWGLPGVFNAATNGMPATIQISNINRTGAAAANRQPWIIFEGTQ